MPTFSHNFIRSTAISHATYDDTSHVLTIIFRTSLKSYTYYGVPPAVWIQFTHASSAGQFVRQQIEPRYSTRR
ncbi:KTSC domain-containing protein [Gluconobacter sp. R75690]|uniref:KTSC domain-containing protein n=1 Tax=unclassified Gluconobacter TaxID=2644261 RepID=UPI00188CCAC3|nr:KTSC domain-containing protein [Gluconobacter sp. R75690]MBF0879718.1 KTSC domain-containing protein [Gluconobacter sp. R75828]